MKWLKPLAAVLLALFALLALVPYLIKPNKYVPVLVEELSAQLRQPVSVESSHTTLFPWPRATLVGVAVGHGPELTARTIKVTPELWSLFTSQKVIGRVELEDVTLSKESLGPLLALVQRAGTASGTQLKNIRLRDATLKLERGSFGPFQLDVGMTGSGNAGVLKLWTEDGGLKARAVPAGERYQLELDAKAWTLPLGAPIRFDELHAKGIATLTHADFPVVEARLYGGAVSGSVSLAWKEDIAVNGKIEVKQVDLAQAAGVLAGKTRVTGRVNATPTFNATAARGSQLRERLKLDTTFSVDGGVLHGIDLAGAGALLLGQPEEGAQTRFQELAGRLQIEGALYRFTQLKVASGNLAARGHVAVAPSKALSGQLTTHINGVTAPSGIPLVIAGSLDAPSVRFGGTLRFR